MRLIGKFGSRALLGALALSAVAACANTALVGANHPAPGAGACAALANRTLTKSFSKLPTSGAAIEGATYVEARYCKLTGSIRPVDPAAPLIKFQVNLPDVWNNKSLQCGGGGLNGNLVSCANALRDAPPGPTPLERGYATFGTDAGHQNAPDKDLQSFALNDEALRNHAYASYKKTFDAAQALISGYYGHKPVHSYFFGGSEGGREALIMAQRFPEDYDGIVSVVPVLSWTGAQFSGYRQYLASSGDGWMSAAKVALVHNATLRACDMNDGLADGMIAKYAGCNAASAITALRCKSGTDEGESCLSDAQIKVVEVTRARTPYGFAISANEIDYPPYATGGESNQGNMVPTVFAPAKPAADDMGKSNYAVGDVRYFFLRDPAHRGPVDWKQYEGRIKEISTLMDATNADLSAFKRRGGKLIIKSNASDFLVSPESVWRYYERVNTTMGQASARDFVRLYVAPWTSHGGNGRAGDGAPTPDKVNLLGSLEDWVERGEAPANQLTLTSYSGAAGNNAVVASWPMCGYPDYPHYKGAGDVKAATSYECHSTK